MALLWEPGSPGRQRQGREGQGSGSESQGPSHSRCPPPPVRPASWGRDPSLEGAEAAGGGGWLLHTPNPNTTTTVISKAYSSLSSRPFVSGDSGQRRGSGWSAPSWARGTQRWAREKR